MRAWAVILSLLLFFAPPASAKTHLRPEIVNGTLLPIFRFPVRWGFSCSFPDDGRLKEEVREGFRYWDDLTPVHLFEEEKACGRVLPIDGIEVLPIHVKYRRDREIVEGTAYYYPTVGRQVGGAIVLWQDWFEEEYPDTRRSIVRHEVGHILLFDHNEETDRCLMSPWINSERYRYHGHEKGLCWSELREFRRRFGGPLP